MNEEKKAAAEAVEKQAKEAAAKAVEKEGEETVTMTKAEVENLLNAAENATKLAEKKTSDAENYKRGMMKYKDKLKENGLDEEEPQITSKEEIAQMIKDAVKEVVPTITKPKEDDELAIANNKIAEMRIALANSKKPIVSAIGSNLEKENGEDKSEAKKFFSPEQVEEIKRKFPNISIEDIYKNMQKPGMGVQS